MNTRILVRMTPETYERIMPMADALVEFYGDRLKLADCLEFSTEDAGIASEELHQVRRWRIESSGKEVDNIDHLLNGKRLQVGERLRHKNRGVYEVYQNEGGKLNIRKAALVMA